MTTGVSAAASSARLGLDLLIAVLEIVGRRKNFSGDLARPKFLCEAARSESERLARCAEEDIAAYGEYMKDRTTEALGRVIEVPMQAARSAVAGLDLCAEASAVVQGAVAADLGAAAILLEGAVRAMLLCVDANLRQLPGHEAAAGRKELEQSARRQLDAVLRKVASAGVES